MDENIAVGLQEELISDLTLELSGEPTFNASALRQKVINAIREVKQARKYPDYYSDEQIQKDIYGYYSIIRKLALFDYNTIGAEFEKSHSENSTNRTWVDRESIFSGVLPLPRF